MERPKIIRKLALWGNEKTSNKMLWKETVASEKLRLEPTIFVGSNQTAIPARKFMVKRVFHWLFFRSICLSSLRKLSVRVLTIASVQTRLFMGAISI